MIRHKKTITDLAPGLRRPPFKGGRGSNLCIHPIFCLSGKAQTKNFCVRTVKPIWQGKPLTLILDHINGKNNDDRLENLRWVCPNCNRQLPTTGFHGNE